MPDNFVTIILIFFLPTATVYKKEEFLATLAVKGSMIGRAPVDVSDQYVVLADRSGMNVNVYENCSEYPLISSFKVRIKLPVIQR